MCSNRLSITLLSLTALLPFSNCTAAVSSPRYEYTDFIKSPRPIVTPVDEAFEDGKKELDDELANKQAKVGEHSISEGSSLSIDGTLITEFGEDVCAAAYGEATAPELAPIARYNGKASLRLRLILKNLAHLDLPRACPDRCSMPPQENSNTLKRITAIAECLSDGANPMEQNAKQYTALHLLATNTDLTQAMHTEIMRLFIGAINDNGEDGLAIMRRYYRVSAKQAVTDSSGNVIYWACVNDNPYDIARARNNLPFVRAAEIIGIHGAEETANARYASYLERYEAFRAEED